MLWRYFFDFTLHFWDLYTQLRTRRTTYLRDIGIILNPICSTESWRNQFSANLDLQLRSLLAVPLVDFLRIALYSAMDYRRGVENATLINSIFLDCREAHHFRNLVVFHSSSSIAPVCCDVHNRRDIDVLVLPSVVALQIDTAMTTVSRDADDSHGNTLSCNLFAILKRRVRRQKCLRTSRRNQILRAIHWYYWNAFHVNRQKLLDSAKSWNRSIWLCYKFNFCYW